MSLAITRKWRQSVVISHGGESIRVTLKKSSSRNPMLVFDGPGSFKVLRSEIAPRPAPDAAVDADDLAVQSWEADGGNAWAPA